MIKPFLKAVLSILCVTSAAFAQEPPEKGYDVKSYEAVIELNRQDTTIRGHAKMHAVVTKATFITRILQHLIYLNIDSVKVNGERATLEMIDQAQGIYEVIAPDGMMLFNEFDLETWYHGKPVPEQNAGKWGGVSHRGGMLFAMGVGFQAPYISCTRHWLPSYDLPDDKADSARVTFLSPSSDIIVASGNLTREFDTLSMRAYEWTIEHPIATYLMTFAMGPFKEMQIENPLQIPFEAYALAPDSARTDRLMRRRVVQGLQYFDSLFAPYPFEKVGYVVAPIGSMEHQTMITLDRRTLDTNNTTAVHELAHMWWGDYVTCHTFNDPWLNEGFATYSESLFLERFDGKQAYRKRQWDKIQSAISNGSDYPMYGAPYHTNHENNYPSAVIYDKGAAVIGMLRYHLGDDRFFGALRRYLSKFAYSTATSFDLWKHFEESSGEDLDWFFQKWVFEKGFPTFEVRWTPGSTTTLDLSQSSTSGYFKLPIVVEATSSTLEKSRRTIWADSAQSTIANVDFGFTPASIQVDPDSVLIAKFNVELASVKRTNALLDIAVGPNPAHTPSVTVSGLTTSHIGHEWSLIDTSGKKVLSGRVTSVPQTLSLLTLTAGSYRLVIENNGQTIATEQVVYQP